MRHLITGGSGFVGNLVARRLRGRGESVRVLDLWSDPSRPADIPFVQGSVLDRDAVAMAMRDVDIVHHHAALVAQTAAGRRYWDVNVEGTRIVAQEAARARVQAIVHISTTAVFGIPPSGPITDKTPLRPIEPYGLSKLAGEQMMEGVCADHAIPLITIRPRATLGAGRLGIFQILFEWIAENRAVYVVGDGHQRIQFVHAHDLMDFYMLALDARRPGTYNVGTDAFGSLRADLEGLIAHAGSRSRVRGLPPLLAANALRLLYHAGVSPLVPWHYRTYHKPCWFDVAPLLRMGWRPRYSNAAMLRESYDWYRTRNLRSEAEQHGTGSPHRMPLRQGLLRVIKQLS